MKYIFIIAALIFFLAGQSPVLASVTGDDIGMVYYNATTTHSTTTDTTEAIYTIPYLLYRFIYALIVICLLIPGLFYLIKISHRL